MMELGIVGYEGLRDFEGPKKMLGAPPCFVFNGDEWDRVHELGKLRNLVLGAARSVDTGAQCGVVTATRRGTRCRRCRSRAPARTPPPPAPHACARAS